MLRILTLSLLALTLSACQDSPSPKTLARITSIRIESTGGELRPPLPKPGLPERLIVASREGEAFSLRVVDNSGLKAEEFKDERAPLTQEEWDSLLRIIADQDLTSWTPKEPKPAPDWGTEGFSIAGEASHGARWNAPLEDGGPYAALRRRLAELARAKLPKVGLGRLGS